MKKCKTMRLAAVLLVCVLLSTCVISGTFAKYTATASGTDTARIAKWGLAAPASLTLDLFDASYNTNAVAAKVPESGTADNVVAPGTSKSQEITLVTLTGAAPEVAYTYTMTVAVSGDGAAASNTIAALDGLAGFNWTLKLPGASEATKYDTFAKLQAAVASLNKTYAANTLPTSFTTGDNKMTIGWEWGFETGADDTAKLTNNTADTAAGDGAAATTDTLKAFTLTLTIGAEQSAAAPAAS